MLRAQLMSFAAMGADVLVPVMIECQADKMREVVRKLKDMGVTSFPVRTSIVYSVKTGDRTIVLTCVIPAGLLDDVKEIDGVVDVYSQPGSVGSTC